MFHPEVTPLEGPSLPNCREQENFPLVQQRTRLTTTFRSGCDEAPTQFKALKTEVSPCLLQLHSLPVTSLVVECDRFTPTTTARGHGTSASKPTCRCRRVWNERMELHYMLHLIHIRVFLPPAAVRYVNANSIGSWHCDTGFSNYLLRHLHSQSVIPGQVGQ